jgi:hypothetical protein
MIWRSLFAAIASCLMMATAGAVGRIADVTVYDRAEGRMLPVYRHDGRYYVVGRPGNEYLVRVRNRTAADILAVVSVDGVNAVSGETAHWSQGGYVLAPRQRYDIMGWRKSTERAAAFYFTDLPDSYAARTGRPDHVGVIGVAVFRKKAEPPARIERPASPRYQPSPQEDSDDTPYPAGSQPEAAAEGGPTKSRSADAAGARQEPLARERRSPALGTGHGRNEASHVTMTRFQRATSSPAEVIAIHYDSHANLVALGVIRDQRASVPSPFPGQFVPDPQ